MERKNPLKPLHSSEELEEERASRAELEQQAATLEAELGLYHHFSWPIFEGQLKREEEKAIEALIGSAVDDEANRARIALIRYLVGRPAEVERQLARTYAEIAGEEQDV